MRAGTNWNYKCILPDLFNREILGYSAGKNKDAQLVKTAFSKIRGNLSDIAIFHTDRGSEFKDELTDTVPDSLKSDTHLVQKAVRTTMQPLNRRSGS